MSFIRSRISYSRMAIIFRFSWFKDRLTRFRVRCPCIIIPINRVSRFVTTEIQLVNVDRTTTRFLNIQDDMTFDKTTTVITTEHLSKVSAGNSQLYITIDIRIVGAAIDLINFCLRHTTQN